MNSSRLTTTDDGRSTPPAPYDVDKLFTAIQVLREQGYLSANSVATQLNARNVASPRGGAWTARSVMNLERKHAALKDAEIEEVAPIRVDRVSRITLVSRSFPRAHAFLSEQLGLSLLKIALNPDDQRAFVFHYGIKVPKPRVIVSLLSVEADAAPAARAGSFASVEFLVPPPAGAARAPTTTRTLPWIGEGAQFLATTDYSGRTEPVIAAVRLHVARLAPVRRFVTGVLGLTPERMEMSDVDTAIYFNDLASPPFKIEVVETGALSSAHGDGAIHHVTFAATSLANLVKLQEQCFLAGFSPSRLLNRTYWKSVFVRIDQMLVEFSCYAPGLGVDEEFGAGPPALRLPPELEPNRGVYERRLREITGALVA